MSDAYVECMVARKTPTYMKTLNYVLVVVAFVSFFYALGTGYTVLILLAIIAGVGAYFVNTYSDVEYEYLYLDKEITVDKVYHKMKRKRVGVFELEKIEIIAPIKSYHLDSYRNRTFKEVDLSSGVENQPEVRYLFYYNGEQKVIFEPNAEMVKMLRNAAPRKVFVD